MHQQAFVAKDGLSYLISINDTGEEILIFLGAEQVGVIDLKRSKGLRGSENFLIRILDLEKCKRKGLGEASLRMHKEIFHRPLTADGDIREGRHSQESQLTRDGIGFIGSMRKKGVIELIDFHDAFSEDE